jgi:hypothetical protein
MIRKHLFLLRTPPAILTVKHVNNYIRQSAVLVGKYVARIKQQYVHDSGFRVPGHCRHTCPAGHGHLPCASAQLHAAAAVCPGTIPPVLAASALDGRRSAGFSVCASYGIITVSPSFHFNSPCCKVCTHASKLIMAGLSFHPLPSHSQGFMAVIHLRDLVTGWTGLYCGAINHG